MSVAESIKEVLGAAVEAAKENPIAAAAIGAGVVGAGFTARWVMRRRAEKKVPVTPASRLAAAHEELRLATEAAAAVGEATATAASL